jgi:anti-anti-sigma factor
MISDETPPPRDPSQDASVTLKLAGEFDISNASELNDQLSATVNSGASQIYIDMAEVTFLDSTGLAQLVRAKTDLAPNRSMVVCNLRPNVRKVFEYTGLAELFGIEP